MGAVWLERKLSADIQTRMGPCRVGKYGLLQLVADAIKLFTKEDLKPLNADSLLFNNANIFMTFTGKPRSDYHGHESPAIMTIPLSILAIFSLVFGGLTKTGFMDFLEETFANSFVNLDIGSLAVLGRNELVGAAGSESLFVQWLPMIVAVAGLAVAFVIYYLRIIKLGPLASMFFICLIVLVYS